MRRGLKADKERSLAKARGEASNGSARMYKSKYLLEER